MVESDSHIVLKESCNDFKLLILKLFGFVFIIICLITWCLSISQIFKINVPSLSVYILEYISTNGLNSDLPLIVEIYFLFLYNYSLLA